MFLDRKEYLFLLESLSSSEKFEYLVCVRSPRMGNLSFTRILQKIFCHILCVQLPKKHLTKKEYEDLLTASSAFPSVSEKYYYLFRKSGATKWVKEAAKERTGIVLITPEDLFEV